MVWQRMGWLVGAALLALPGTGSAQEVNYDTVSATIRTLNTELGAALERSNATAVKVEEEALAHIQPRQAYYRLQRVARRAMRWGQQHKVDPVALPPRPAGQIGPDELDRMATVALQYVQNVNKRIGVQSGARVGVLPGKLPGDLFKELGESLALLDALSGSIAVQARPQAPEVAVDDDGTGKRQRKKR